MREDVVVRILRGYMMIKYLVMDIDGSLTDGKIYFGNDGEMMKAFSVKDGYAIKHLLKRAGIEPIVITARSSEIVMNRCAELEISKIYQGKVDKLVVLNEILCGESLQSCAYFGDDILDLDCISAVKEARGITGSPADAAIEVRGKVDYVCLNKAGEGALREFTEWLMSADVEMISVKKRVDAAIDYIESMDKSELKPGIYVVNDNFYYIVQEYMTGQTRECHLESHRKNINIQWILQGEEIVEIADCARLCVEKDYDTESDVMFWRRPERTAESMLRKNSYIVIYPETAYMAHSVIGIPEKIKKIVARVKVF